MKRVVIVGGGPSGSLLAYHLARAGVETVVLERSRFPRDKACGEFINPLGVACLAAACLLNDVLGAGARWIDRAKLVFPSGSEIESPLSPALSRSSRKESLVGGPGFQRGLTLPRRDLDSILLAGAETAGAEIRQGFRVGDIERDERVQGWRVTGRGLTSGPETLEADLIVGADGAGSVVARRMGWLLPAWPRRMGLTASFRGMDMEPGVIEMHMLPDAYCGSVRQHEGVTHVGLAFHHLKGEAPGGSSLEPFLLHALTRFPRLQERMGSAEVAGPVKAFGPMAVRSRKRAGDGVLLVGDAAGFLDPVTGHGIGFAMRSAELAAEALIPAVAAGDLSRRRLDAYSRAYDREFRSALRLYAGLQRVLGLPRPILGLLGNWLDSHPGPVRALIPRLVGNSAPRSSTTDKSAEKVHAASDPIDPSCSFCSPLPVGEGPGKRSVPPLPCGSRKS